MCLKDPFFWRQMLLLTGGCLHSIGAGIVLAYPNSLNAAILSPNATEIRATVEQASWIASARGFSGLLSFFIICPLFQIIGRKPVNIICNVIVIIGWIATYYSYSVTILIIAMLIKGLATSGIFVSAVTINEFTHRKYRGTFLTVKKIALACGSLLCHSLALVWDWRQIAAISVVPNIVALVVIFLCPESPAFYALKGRFEECEKSFTWFHGDSVYSRKELKHLIIAQMEKIKEKEQRNKTPFAKKIVLKLFQRDFLIPFSIASLATIAVDASGRFFLLGYITQIMVELVGDKYIAMYCSMIGDCIIIIAFIISTFIITNFKRRTIMFTFGCASLALMFAVSLSEVVNNSLPARVKWVTPFIILFHSFVTTVGMIPAAFTVSTEVFPLDHRGMGSLTTGLAFTLFYAVTMKVTPVLLVKTGVGGTYFVYGLCVALCLIMLYFILPETKDKTLQEIEDLIKRVERKDVELETKLLNDPKSCRT